MFTVSERFEKITATQFSYRPGLKGRLEALRWLIIGTPPKPYASVPVTIGPVRCIMTGAGGGRDDLSAGHGARYPEIVTAGEQRGAGTACKAASPGSIPASASKPISGKYAPLGDMRWYWRWIYWPLRHFIFTYVEYPLTKKNHVFMDSIREQQQIAADAIEEREFWKQKYIEISKENSALKREQPTKKDGE
jgi:hypothetical protein